MDSAQIVLPALRGVVHKKLEDIVLTAMDDPNNILLNFTDAAEIARIEGFQEIQQGIEEIQREVGQIQIERNIKRAKQKDLIDLKEARMNHYFSELNGLALPILEDGLQFLGSEVDILGGRVDIHAKGKDDRSVFIELKANSYDKSVAIQLQRYLNDPTLADTRLIFAAPEIHPNYFFGFKHFADEGRIKFIELKEVSPDTYVFSKEVSTNDFSFNPKTRKYARRKQNGNEKVRVTSRVSQRENGNYRKIKLDTELQVEFEGGEEIEQGSFNKEFENFSLLEKIAATVGLEIVKPIEAKIPVPEINYQILMDNLKVELKPYPERPSWVSVKEMFERISIKNKKEIKIVNRFLNFANVGDDKKNLDSLLSSILTLYGPHTKKGVVKFKDGNDTLQYGSDLENRICLIDRGLEALKHVYGSFYFSGEHKNLEALLNRRKRLNPNSPTNDAITAALSWADKEGTEAIIQALELKNQRAKMLHSISPDLAFIYMTNTPAINYLLKDRTLYESAKITIEDSDLRDFIKNDQQLYKEILELLQPIPEEKPSQLETTVKRVDTPQTIQENTAYQNGNRTTDNGHTKPELEVKPREDTIRDKCNGQKLKHPKAETLKAANRFVKEILNSGNYDVNLLDRITTALSRSKWYELRDVDTRGFLEDIAYCIKQGKVPTKQEINTLLKEGTIDWLKQN